MKNLKEFLMLADPVAELYEMVEEPGMKTLRAFLPEIADLRMEIPTGAHHKDNLVHSIQVLENAIARETDGADLILRTAALYHDVGKPATRKFGARKSVSFDGHETVGARMMKKILSPHGFDKKEIAEIHLLIKNHMRAHGFAEQKWTDSGVRRIIAEVPDAKTLDRLIVIFYADVTSKHKKNRDAVYRSVDMFVEALAEVREKDARKALRPAIDGNEVMEMTGLTPSRELGMIMKFLNSDEGIALSREEAEAYVRSAVS